MCYLEGTEIAPAVERLRSWAAFPRVPGLIYLPQPGCPYPVLLCGGGTLGDEDRGCDVLLVYVC